MKFAVDCMLGKLAKWLRIIGFDVVYFSKVEDDELLNIARRERRTLLTRDSGLRTRSTSLPCLMIESQKWKDQLVQVLDIFDLGGEVKPYSRCLQCNRPLKALPRERARNLVTPYIFEHARSFVLCSACGRLFWKGTHFDDMESKLSQILSDLKKGREKRTSTAQD